MISLPCRRALFFDFEGFDTFPMVFSGSELTQKVAVLDQKGGWNDPRTVILTGAIGREKGCKGTGGTGFTRITTADCADAVSETERSQHAVMQRVSALRLVFDAVSSPNLVPREGRGGGCRRCRVVGNDDGLRRTRIPLKGSDRSVAFANRRLHHKGGFGPYFQKKRARRECHIMNAENTLKIVRELSERALVRPAPKTLECQPWPPQALPPCRLATEDSAWIALQKNAAAEQLHALSRTPRSYR